MTIDDNQYLCIPLWAEEDRPREKLLLKGKSTLSDAELLAILIGSGTRSMSAVEVSRQLLKKADFDLNQLARMTINDLEKQKGIGRAKAITIISALELGRRRKDAQTAARQRITCSGDVYQLLKPDMLDLPHEEFWIVILNRANDVMAKTRISSGGISGTVADPKLIFKHVLDHFGSSLILAHNHPSGNLKPSEADIRLTKKLRTSGEMMEIPVLDHIIFGDENYFSFADEGIL